MSELENYELRCIALAAMVDTRTLCRALSGHPVRPMIRRRIRDALTVRGLEHLLMTAEK